MRLPLPARARLWVAKAAVSALGMGGWVNSVILRNGEAWPGSWQAGMTIETTDNLFRFASVYACVALISDDVAKLRARVMRKAPDGIWDEVTEADRSPFLPLLRRPNRYQTWPQFIQQWVTSKLVCGNAYVYIERDNRQMARALYVLDPRRVLPSIAPDGEVYYQLSAWDLIGQREARAVVDASEVIHDRMTPIWFPLIGVSPLYSCGIAATVGIRIQNQSEKLFTNLSRPYGQLVSPGTLTQEQVDQLKKQFEAGFSGTNLGRLFVATGGLEFKPIAMPANDAQLAEQHKISIEEVARAFKVPLYKISAGAYPNLTSVGAINQDYYDHAIQIHITSIEQLLNQALGLPALGMRFDIDEGGLMRMDPLGRAEVAEKQIKAGVLAPNEGRAQWNLHPVTGGAQPYLQQQNFSLAALAKRDAQEDPFGTAKPQPAPAPASEPEGEDEDDASEEETRALIDTIAKGLDLEATV